VEEHYILEKEEWRYDKFPEFYNGSNVLDFYDPDITEKLNALEKEEEELLKMEGMQDDLMNDEEIDGIKTSDLKLSLKEVRAKKAIYKMEHKLKINRTHFNKKHDLTDVIEHMESKGIPVNKEKLRSHSKVRKSIKDLEDAQDKKANRLLADSESDGDVVEDDEIAGREAENRGRKRKRSSSPGDLMMEVDQDFGGSAKKSGRTMTPQQRHVSAQQKHRSLT